MRLILPIWESLFQGKYHNAESISPGAVHFDSHQFKWEGTFAHSSSKKPIRAPSQKAQFYFPREMPSCSLAMHLCVCRVSGWSLSTAMSLKSCILSCSCSCHLSYFSQRPLGEGNGSELCQTEKGEQTGNFTQSSSKQNPWQNCKVYFRRQREEQTAEAACETNGLWPWSLLRHKTW